MLKDKAVDFPMRSDQRFFQKYGDNNNTNNNYKYTYNLYSAFFTPKFALIAFHYSMIILQLVIIRYLKFFFKPIYPSFFYTDKPTLLLIRFSNANQVCSVLRPDEIKNSTIGDHR